MFNDRQIARSTGGNGSNQKPSPDVLRVLGTLCLLMLLSIGIVKVSVLALTLPHVLMVGGAIALILQVCGVSLAPQ